LDDAAIVTGNVDRVVTRVDIARPSCIVNFGIAAPDPWAIHRIEGGGGVEGNAITTGSAHRPALRSPALELELTATEVRPLPVGRDIHPDSSVLDGLPSL
jgi:hypothetical protein